MVHATTDDFFLRLPMLIYDFCSTVFSLIFPIAAKPSNDVCLVKRQGKNTIRPKKRNNRGRC